MSEHEIIAADDRRFQAMVKQDWAALSSALADDLVYVHSSARVESKKEHVSNLQAVSRTIAGLRRASARCGCAATSASSTAWPKCTWRTPARNSTSRSATSRCTRKSPTAGR